MWAAWHLRAPAVVLVTTTTLAANCGTLSFLRPAAETVSDFVFFGAVLAVMALMLVRSIQVQDTLIDVLREQLTVDSLTGLATRREFDRALAGALRRSVRAQRRWCSSTSTRSHRSTNSHGHPVGDDVLVHLAAVRRGRVRAEDAVLSRLGGDELAILMPGCHRKVAAERAEELLEAVRSTPIRLVDGQLLALSISVGVAHVPQHSTDRWGLFTAADAALYDAKRAGRGRVSVAGA